MASNLFTFGAMKPSALLICAVSLAAFACSKEPSGVSTDAHASAAAASTASEGAAIPKSDTGTASTTGATASGAGASQAALPVLGPAPSWKLRNLEGKDVSFDEFKGKVVVVDFWATWCPPCRAEIPGYVEMVRKYGDKLVIVGVSLDKAAPKVVQDFAKKFQINYPIVMGDDAIQTAFGGIEAIPTTFLIDQNGQIRDKKVGAEEAESYEKKIAALLRS